MLLWFLLVLGTFPMAQAQQPTSPPDLGSESARQRVVQTIGARLRQEKQTAAEKAREKGWAIRGITPDGARYELMKLMEGRPLYYMTSNVNAAISTGANRLRGLPYNVNGAGLTIGVWDGGSVRSTHQEFGSRVVIQDGGAYDDHATHVGGTLGAGGVDAGALGMASAAAIHSYEWTDDLAEMTSRAASAPNQSNNLYVSNHSYGPMAGWEYGTWSSYEGPHWIGAWPEREERGFGMYDSLARDWDALCYSAPYYLPFKAAGNDRDDAAPAQGALFYYYFEESFYYAYYNGASHPYGDGFNTGGYDTIGYQGTSKNIMTVGAVDDAVNGGNRDVSRAAMSTFSGWGPADDGRVKPDIVANGVGVYSTIASGNTAYGVMDGTSMASPNAAGSALLLVQYYRSLFAGQDMRSSMLKGLIIHTADDLGNPGPDYRHGWGLMNAKAAADHIQGRAAVEGALNMVEAQLTNAQPTREYVFTWNGVGAIRATLCWTDPPGAAQDGLDLTTPALVNDLDLRIIGPDGATTHLPYVLNPASPDSNAAAGDNSRDNVEQIRIAAPGAGQYTVRISHKGALTGGLQHFALLVTGHLAGAAPEGETPVEGEGEGENSACTALLAAPAASATVSFPTTFSWTASSACGNLAILFSATADGAVYSGYTVSGNSVQITREDWDDLRADLGLQSAAYWTIGQVINGNQATPIAPYRPFSVVCTGRLISPTPNAEVALPAQFSWQTDGGCQNLVLVFSATPDGASLYGWNITGTSDILSIADWDTIRANLNILGQDRCYWTIGLTTNSGEVTFLAPLQAVIIKALETNEGEGEEETDAGCGGGCGCNKRLQQHPDFEWVRKHFSDWFLLGLSMLALVLPKRN